MKVVILGKGEMLASLIQGVSDSGANIVGIFRYERTAFSSFKLFLHDFFKSSPDVTLIKQKKLNEIKCKSANSEAFKKEILKLNPDIILVGTWKERLKKDIINLPKIATINVHPSLLPYYKGPNPYIQTILNGEPKSGLTFHLMTEEVDGGPILAQQKIDILPCDTAKELKEKTVFFARPMACELMKRLDCEIIQPVEQKGGSYYPNITGDEKMLDFKNQTSTQVINTIRALHPYLPAYVTVGKKFFIVNPYKARIIDKTGEAGKLVDFCAKTRSLTFACKDGKCVKMSGLKLYRFAPLTKFFINLIKTN